MNKRIFLIMLMTGLLLFNACGTSGMKESSSNNDMSSVEESDAVGEVVEDVESIEAADQMEDGVIQYTNVFTIEEKLKSTEYSWSEDHGVIEGKSGYFGTCLCEEKDIWCDLYAEDSYEIESAEIDVYEEDYELLITFVSFFDGSLIDVEEVQQWIQDFDSESEESSMTSGDADFYLQYDVDENKYSLFISALE